MPKAPIVRPAMFHRAASKSLYPFSLSSPTFPPCDKMKHKIHIALNQSFQALGDFKKKGAGTDWSMYMKLANRK